MITVENNGDLLNKKPLSYMGLSTDTKPSGDIPNGSSLYEMDAKKAYLYDAKNKKWIEQ